MPDLYSRDVGGKRKWYADCYYWANGQRRRKRRSTGIVDDGTAKSKRTASIVARDIEQSLAAGEGRTARPDTLAQAITALVASMELAQLSPRSVAIAIEKAAHLYAHFGSKKPVASITDADLVAYAHANLGEQADGKRAAGTIHRELTTLRQACKALELVPPKMPDLGVVYTPVERWLDHAEMLRLMAAVGVGRKDHVLVYRLLGLRKGELDLITAADCNWSTNEVRVRGTKTTGADRLMPMHPDVRDVLWSRRELAPMFEPWLRGNADRDLKAAADRAGLDPISFNDLRRSFATEMAIKGVPILHLARLMGHRSTRMLERVYARVSTGAHMHEAIGVQASLRPRAQKGKRAL